MDVYQALMELNYLGTVSVTKQVLPHMIRRGSGVIATISSVAGFVGVPLATGYAASKHAVQVRANGQNSPRICQHVMQHCLVKENRHKRLKKAPDLLFLQGFFNSLRTELAEYPNIAISTICPGPVISSIVQNAFTEELGKVFAPVVCFLIK